MIIDGKEFRLVPVEATPEMEDAYITELETGEACIMNGITAAIAAAPQPPEVVVSDEVAERIDREWMRMPMRRDCSPDAACGRDMIAAVQSVLGPTLGLVPREDVASAYRDGNALKWRDGRYMVGNWEDSETRKRLAHLMHLASNRQDATP